MHKSIKALIVILILLSPLPVTAKAETITKTNDLIENAKTLDGQKLTIEGEAIGERMIRGDYSWVNINDGSNAIGVWLSNKEAEKIKYYGNYKNIGDTVRVTGVFYRACKEHGGEADFHATSLVVNEIGHSSNIKLSISKMIAAVLLSGAALILFMVFHKIKGSMS